MTRRLAPFNEPIRSKLESWRFLIGVAQMPLDDSQIAINTLGEIYKGFQFLSELSSTLCFLSTNYTTIPELC
jgi:hypothetical protein